MEITEEEEKVFFQDFIKKDKRFREFLYKRNSPDPLEAEIFSLFAAYHAGALENITALSSSDNPEVFMEKVKENFDLGSAFGREQFKAEMAK